MTSVNVNLRDEMAKDQEMRQATSELLEQIKTDKEAMEEELRDNNGAADGTLCSKLQNDQLLCEIAKEEHRVCAGSTPKLYR